MAINSIAGNTILTSGSFPPVRVASTGSPLNPSAGGLLVVDGVQLVAGDRVLCKDEANAINNGIYAATTGPWVRTTDATNNQQFFSGMAVTVALGAVNAGLTYICTTTDDPVVVGTSNITFGAQSVVATATQSATSATSLVIGTGSKTFTTQAGKAFQLGQYVLVNETSNSANQMLGQITAYSGTSLTINVIATGGSGTHADWTIALTNSAAAAGLLPPVGSGNVTGPGSSTAGHIATFADGTGKVLQDGGAPVGAANTITPAMLTTAAVAFAVGMLNGTIVSSVAANALTIAMKTLAGADPSSSDPVFFFIRDATAGYVVIEQTAALSITVPANATLGTVNGQANRIWLAAFNNGGSALLGVYNTLSGTNIVPWDETAAANGTGVTSSSNSAQTWYTASTVSAKNLRVLGYLESTQATAGTWATIPSKSELLGPGVKRPGEMVGNANTVTGGGGSTSSATLVPLAGQNVTMNISSASNLIRVEAYGTISCTLTASVATRLSRGAVANTNMIGNNDRANITASNLSMPGALLAYDVPNVIGNQVYSMQGGTGAGIMTWGPTGIMSATELQI